MAGGGGKRDQEGLDEAAEDAHVLLAMAEGHGAASERTVVTGRYRAAEQHVGG